MNKFKWIIFLFLLLLPGLTFASDPGEILKAVQEAGQKYYVPSGEGRAKAGKGLDDSVIGWFGEYRASIVRGHLHSGIDIKGNFNGPVFSIGKGVVVNIFRDFPDKTVYIRHTANNSVSFYSAYIHIKDIQVNVGERVTENTLIGRIFNSDELAAAKFGTPPHLHLEIRHSIIDDGEATFNCMSIDELNMFFIDPLKLFN